MTTITAVKANSILAKTQGLIGKHTIQPIYFETRFGIHTFGVRHPIDVVILNNTNTVVKLKMQLRPNSFFFWNPKFYKVLELPDGTIKKDKIDLGSTISLVFY